MSSFKDAPPARPLPLAGGLWPWSSVIIGLVFAYLIYYSAMHRTRPMRSSNSRACFASCITSGTSTSSTASSLVRPGLVVAGWVPLVRRERDRRLSAPACQDHGVVSLSRAGTIASIVDGLANLMARDLSMNRQSFAPPADGLHCAAMCCSWSCGWFVDLRSSALFPGGGLAGMTYAVSSDIARAIPARSGSPTAIAAS